MTFCGMKKTDTGMKPFSGMKLLSNDQNDRICGSCCFEARLVRILEVILDKVER